MRVPCSWLKSRTALMKRIAASPRLTMATRSKSGCMVPPMQGTPGDGARPSPGDEGGSGHRGTERLELGRRGGARKLDRPVALDGEVDVAVRVDDAGVEAPAARGGRRHDGEEAAVGRGRRTDGPDALDAEREPHPAARPE